MSNIRHFKQLIVDSTIYALLISVIEIIAIILRGRSFYIDESFLNRSLVLLSFAINKITIFVFIAVFVHLGLQILRIYRRSDPLRYSRYFLFFIFSIYISGHYTVRFFIPHGYEIDFVMGLSALTFSVICCMVVGKTPASFLSGPVLTIAAVAVLTSMILTAVSTWTPQRVLYQPTDDAGFTALEMPAVGRTNVVYVVVDAMASSHLHALGYPRSNTPFLDDFKEKCLVFPNFRSGTSATSSSTATLFTARYPGNNGTHDQKHLPASEFTAAEFFQSLGYRTLLVSANVRVTGALNMDQGFEEVRFENSAEASWMVEEFTTLLEGESDRPFFAYLHFMETHTPYLLEDRFRTTFMDDEFTSLLPEPFKVSHTSSYGGSMVDPSPGFPYRTQGQYVAQYDAAILQMDHYFSRLIEFLKEKNLYENTIIAFSSDHGEFMGDWSIFCKHAAMPFRNQINVPLLIKYDDHHVDFDDLFENREVIPMIANLINRTPASTMEIENVVRESMKGFAVTKKGENLTFSEGFAIEKDQFKFVSNPCGVSVMNTFKIPHSFWPWQVRELVVAGPYHQYLYTEMFFEDGDEMTLIARHPQKTELRRLLMKDMVRTDYVEEELPGLNRETKEMLKTLGYLQ